MNYSRLLLMSLLLCAACGSSKPETIELNRSFLMVDEEGRNAGTVVFRPLGDGEIRDASNRVIGVIVAPAAR